MSDLIVAREAENSLCPSFLAAMQVLGKRWNGIIIQAIGTSRLRYSDLKEQVTGISDAVLTARLSELTDCELLVRHAAGSGRRGEYALSEKGLELIEVLDALTSWADRWSFEQASPHGSRSTP